MFKFKSPKLIASIMLIFVFAFGFSTGFFMQESRAESQFDITVKDIDARIKASLQFDGKYLVNGIPLGMSSNPYDYVKDNVEFLKLISYGDDIVDDLTAMQKDKNKYDSFERYILAIALEEITKTDLKSYDDYKWDEAEKFSDAWEKFKVNASEKVLEIINNKGLTNNEKWAEISKYGTLAIPALKGIEDQENKELANKIVNMLSTSDRKSVIMIAKGEKSPPQ